MSAKDLYHDQVKNALIKDGWTITHDPLRLRVGRKKLFIDLGAEQLIAAVKGSKKIAVEIKSFLSKSDVEDLEKALGQYTLYFDVLSEAEPDRELYLAVSVKIFDAVFEDEIGKLLLRKGRLRLLVFNDNTEEIARWIT